MVSDRLSSIYDNKLILFVFVFMDIPYEGDKLPSIYDNSLIHIFSVFRDIPGAEREETVPRHICNERLPEVGASSAERVRGAHHPVWLGAQSSDRRGKSYD